MIDNIKLLTATNVNWSCRRKDDWSHTIYELYDYGKLSIEIYKGEQIERFVAQLSENDLILVKAILNNIQNKESFEKVNACDGDAWSLSIYDKFGKEIYHKETGYTYGLIAFETLQNILKSYVK